MTSTTMMRRYPPRRFAAGRAAVTDMAGTIPNGTPNRDYLSSIWRADRLPVALDNHDPAAWACAGVHAIDRVVRREAGRLPDCGRQPRSDLGREVDSFHRHLREIDAEVRRRSEENHSP